MHAMRMPDFVDAYPAFKNKYKKEDNLTVYAEYDDDDFIEKHDRNGLLISKRLKKNRKPRFYRVNTEKFSSIEEVAIHLDLNDFNGSLYLDDMLPESDIVKLCDLKKLTRSTVDEK